MTMGPFAPARSFAYAFVVVRTQSHTVFLSHISCLMDVEAVEACGEFVEGGDEIYATFTGRGNDITLHIGFMKNSDCATGVFGALGGM
jgi:hypothetical protein